MRTKTCMLLFIGFSFFILSKAHASITWDPGNTSADIFDYHVQDLGGYYVGGQSIVVLNASGQKSSANGDSENTAVATASEPQTGITTPGLTMAAAAWGNSFQDSSKDSGGASVYAYATNNYALDSPVGVMQNGQKVVSYIDRPFTVTATGAYTLSALAAAPVAWKGTTSGSATAPQPQLSGCVQIYQTDPSYNTTTLLDPKAFSLSNLSASGPQVQATVNLVAGDTYQLVVAISGIGNVGGESGIGGITTTFNNLNSYSGAWLGGIDGTFNAGTQKAPVTISAAISPAPWLWQNATDLGGGWMTQDPFGPFYVNAQWIYLKAQGTWLYALGSTTADIWFYDSVMNTWWWTSQTVYPYVYRQSDQAWLYYDSGASPARNFYNYKTGAWETD